MRRVCPESEVVMEPGTKLVFRGVPGAAMVRDGVAAGGAWWLFEFEGGPLDGKKIWCLDLLEGRYQYLMNTEDDGFLFNSGMFKWGDGGDMLPDWHERILEVRE